MSGRRGTAAPTEAQRRELKAAAVKPVRTIFMHDRRRVSVLSNCRTAGWLVMSSPSPHFRDWTITAAGRAALKETTP